MDIGQVFINAVITAAVVGIVGGFFGYLWHRFKKADNYVSKEDLPDMIDYRTTDACDELRSNCEGSRMDAEAIRGILSEHRDEQRISFDNFKEEIRNDVKETKDFVSEVNRRVWDLANNKPVVGG